MTKTLLDEMRTQAERLGFSLPDELLTEIAESTQSDSDSDFEATVSSGTDRGHVADDAENALLAVYDEPRVHTDSGILAGVTVAVKDNIAVADLEMTCGSAAYALVPSFDAPAVSRLLDEGATLVGKANMEPFAMGPTGEFSDFGHVTNPLDPDRVAGGSSSGSAAAVAAGTVDVALGTDTGGSIRIPAACCGVVGVKPSHRLVPRYGFVDFAPSLDTIGPISTDVQTGAKALATMAGPDPRDPTAANRPMDPDAVDETLDSPEGLTVGVPDTPFDRSDERVADAVREVVDRLEDLGITVEPVELDLGETEFAYLSIGSAEFSWLLAGNGVVRGQGTGYSEELRDAFERARNEGLGEHVARRILPPAFLDATTGGAVYASARREGIAFGERLATVFEQVDAIVTPTLRSLPPGLGETTTRDDFIPLLGNTAPFNIAGTPAVSVPVTTLDGHPVSAQAIAPQFEDSRALQVARSLERVAD
ncbi:MULTISPECIES: amidase [Haloferax]|uniref:Asp-tRNA(Asn)/Glu-tRNA(Gln) amidotransferase subunit GatA n=2 Tax=Haloferax TaxID=2251 RepID=A0A6G1Z6H0_9EURY|nr:MULTISPECIES: amidase [Haloferax]KAB1185446.1 Asp-tRNA(Asn)/Glu-tRNA(Gln) amidotransferase subunit GatA [Haloferax sp. CBA1149]MRW82093.1 Asp-tRNA(Asn)/Glu-tRNA(Gln) amidotransferase subunit GatA [Haloferax marinisediminis]